MKNINKMNEQELDELLEFGEKFKKRLEDSGDLKIITDIEDRENNTEEQQEENITKQMKLLHFKIDELQRKKQETIKAVIGQMYKGVLIDGKLSIRNGEVYEYKYHNNNWLSIGTIKRQILENLHQVKEKISEKNLEILEFILDCIKENENESKSIITLKLPKTYWFAFFKTINEKIKEVSALDNELIEIKEKAGDLLIVAQLKKDNKNTGEMR